MHLQDHHVSSTKFSWRNLHKAGNFQDTLKSKVKTQASCLGVCFITAGPITKLFAWGGRRVEDMCYERRRAECVDESAHHVLVNAGGREIV